MMVIDGCACPGLRRTSVPTLPMSRCNSKRGNMDLSAWLDVSCGDDARRVSALIVEHVALDLKPFKAEAKAVIARRIK